MSLVRRYVRRSPSQREVTHTFHTRGPTREDRHPGGMTKTDPEHLVLSPSDLTQMPDVQGVLRTEPTT